MEQEKPSLLTRITNWARDIELNVTQEEDPKVDFHLLMWPSQGEEFPVDVIHPQITGKYVIFVVNLLIIKEIQQQLLSTEKSFRDKMLWDIRFRLLQMNVDFRIMNPEIELPNLWQLTIRMVVEVLTPKFSMISTLRSEMLHSLSLGRIEMLMKYPLRM